MRRISAPYDGIVLLLQLLDWSYYSLIIVVFIHSSPRWLGWGSFSTLLKVCSLLLSMIIVLLRRMLLQCHFSTSIWAYDSLFITILILSGSATDRRSGFVICCHLSLDVIAWTSIAVLRKLILLFISICSRVYSFAWTLR